MEKTLLPEEEVLHNIELKKAEFQGLIDSNSAARLIAKELGIALNEPDDTQFLNLADIMLSKPIEANAIVRVMNVNSPKDFETAARKGKVCNVEIADNSGKALLVLWDEDVRWLERVGLERDDVLVIKSGQVKSYNPLEIHSSLTTEILQQKQMEFIGSIYYRPIAQIPSKLAKIKDLSDGQMVDIFGRILQISHLREFAKEKRMGKVLNLLIADGDGGQIPIVLWDYHAENGSRLLRPGIAIKAENALAKKTGGGLELHLNWASNLIISPKTHNLMEEDEMLKDTLPQVRLLDMKAGTRGIVKAYFGKISKVELRIGNPQSNGRLSGNRPGELVGHSGISDERTLFVIADIRDEINVPVEFLGRQALEILQLRGVPAIPLDLAIKLKEEYIKDKRVSMVVRKEKDKTGKITKYICEHVLNFI